MNDAYSGYSADTDGSEGGGDLIAYLPSILWQRRWWIIVPTVLCTIVGLAAAVLLPARYRSSATLLVESPELPAQLVGQQQSTSLIDQRIAKIRQQVLSRPDLIELIENNNLYPDERASKPLSEVIDKMRKATNLSPVSADIQTGPGGTNTIAFSLTFDYPDPQKAQVVAQDFVERLVKLDAAQTSQAATGTVEFLQDQANGLVGQINAIERQIEAIKAANGMALSTGGMMMLGGGAGGGYQAQIAGLQRENAQLQAQLKLQANATDRDPSVQAAEAQLAAAQAVYSDTHPDVLAARQRLAEARKFAAANVARSNTDSAIRSQIASNAAAISSLQAAMSNDTARTSALANAQAKAPAVNEQIAQLQAKADGLRTNYQTVQTNLINARGSARITEQQRGERLSVIDPPVAPDRPTWPNRPLLALGGIAAGAALGLGIALVLEFIMRPIRGVASLQSVTGEPPMVIIPQIAGRRPAPDMDGDDSDSTQSKRRWFRRRKRAADPAVMAG